jgi:hypothetical protein
VLPTESRFTEASAAQPGKTLASKLRHRGKEQLKAKKQPGPGRIGTNSPGAAARSGQTAESAAADEPAFCQAQGGWPALAERSGSEGNMPSQGGGAGLHVLGGALDVLFGSPPCSHAFDPPTAVNAGSASPTAGTAGLSGVDQTGAQAKSLSEFRHVPDPPYGPDDLRRLDTEFGRPFREFQDASSKTGAVWRGLMAGMTMGFRPGGDLIDMFSSRPTAVGYNSVPRDFPMPDWSQMSGKAAFAQMHRNYLTAQGLEDEVRKRLNKSARELQIYHLKGQGSPEVVTQYERCRELLGLMMAYQERAGIAMEHLDRTGRWQEMRW